MLGCVHAVWAAGAGKVAVLPGVLVVVFDRCGLCGGHTRLFRLLFFLSCPCRFVCALDRARLGRGGCLRRRLAGPCERTVDCALPMNGGERPAGHTAAASVPRRRPRQLRRTRMRREARLGRANAPMRAPREGARTARRHDSSHRGTGGCRSQSVNVAWVAPRQLSWYYTVQAFFLTPCLSVFFLVGNADAHAGTWAGVDRPS